MSFVIFFVGSLLFVLNIVSMMLNWKKPISFFNFVVAGFLLATMLNKPAHAEAVYGLHVASQHLPDKGQNNFNPGAYVRFGDTSIGAYHNSYRDTTVYVSQSYAVGYGFELVGGVAYGYQRSGTSRGALTPMGGITYTSPVKIFGMTPKLFAIPPTPKNSAVVHLAMEF
jgi:hypothetical protein